MFSLNMPSRDGMARSEDEREIKTRRERRSEEKGRRDIFQDEENKGLADEQGEAGMTEGEARHSNAKAAR